MTTLEGERAFYADASRHVMQAVRDAYCSGLVEPLELAALAQAALAIVDERNDRQYLKELIENMCCAKDD